MIEASVDEIGHEKWLIGPISLASSEIASENTGYLSQMVPIEAD